MKAVLADMRATANAHAQWASSPEATASEASTSAYLAALIRHWLTALESQPAADAVARTAGSDPEPTPRAEKSSGHPAVSSAPPQELDNHHNALMCRYCNPHGDLAVEEDTIKHIVTHWFTQGGEAEFGAIGEPRNADELIAAILGLVRQVSKP